jgi:hypothetical protein
MVWYTFLTERSMNTELSAMSVVYRASGTAFSCGMTYAFGQIKRIGRGLADHCADGRATIQPDDVRSQPRLPRLRHREP